MNWIVYDPNNNLYLQSSDYDGYPAKWIGNKSWAKVYSDKEIMKVLIELRKFGFENLEQVGYVKRSA